MNQQLPDRNGDSRTRRRALSGWGSSGFARALVFAWGLAVFSTTATTRPGPLVAAEAGWNSSLFLAQTQPKNDRRRLRLPAGSNVRRTSSADSTTAAGTTKAGSTESDAAAKPEAEKSSRGFSLVRWIREHAVWIVVALVCAIAGVVVWVFLGGRGSGGVFDEELEVDSSTVSAGSSGGGRSRYSTTRIHARDVNDRLGVDSSEVETDREYALVVDEEALKKPEVDERTGQVYADASDIEALIEERKFDDAFDTYTHRIRASEIVEFRSEVEKALSEHFLNSRQFDKAARILEHHITTHASADIAPDTYFNLGYIHFFSQRVKKSERYLKMYVERENDSARADRARRILDALEESSAT